MEVIAHINANTPTGRKIIRQLETHTKTVRLEYPAPPLTEEKFYTHDEVWSAVEEKMNSHYGTNCKLDF